MVNPFESSSPNEEGSELPVGGSLHVSMPNPANNGTGHPGKYGLQVNAQDCSV